MSHARMASLFPELDTAPAAPAAGRMARRPAPMYARCDRPEVGSAVYWRQQMTLAETPERRTYCHDMWLLCMRALSREPDPSNKNH